MNNSVRTVRSVRIDYTYPGGDEPLREFWVEDPSEPGSWTNLESGESYDLPWIQSKIERLQELEQVIAQA